LNLTKDKILKSALDVFSHKGYADATITAIAKLAGVNNLTIFRHFVDKKTLFLSVVDCYADVSFDSKMLDSLLSYDNISKDLSVLAHEYFKIVFSNIDILRIFIGESVYFKEIKEKAWFIPPALEEHFENYLKRVKTDANLSKINSHLTSEMFVSHIVRRALEYNKHSSIWELSNEILEEFDNNMKPLIELMVTFFV